MHLTTFYKEDDPMSYKAEIHENNEGFRVDYFNPGGNKTNSANYADKSIAQVEDIVETWIASIKVLNG